MASRTRRLALGATALAASLLSLGATTAQASQLGSGEEPIDATFEFSGCGDIDLSLHAVGTSAYVDKLRSGHPENFAYLTAWFTRVLDQTTQTVTNLDTGRSFVNVIVNKERDQRLLATEGTAITMRRFGTFNRTLYSDGVRQYVSVGTWWYDYTQDTLGTSDPQDDIVDAGPVTLLGGNGRNDFCADVLNYTS